MDKEQLVIVKHGSSVVENAGGIGLNQSKIDFHVVQHVLLRAEGLQTAEVASGAVVEGIEYVQEMRKIKGDIREEYTDSGLAMLGTARQIKHWEDAARPHSLLVAQLLASHVEIDDNVMQNSSGNLIVKNLLHQTKLGTLVIANENNAASFQELIEFEESKESKETSGKDPESDNDWMAAHLAIAAGAAKLILLINKKGFIVGDKVMSKIAIEDIDGVLHHCDEASSSGTGGMRSKLFAAKKAAMAGVEVTIGYAFTDIRRLLAHDEGTRVVE